MDIRQEIFDRFPEYIKKFIYDHGWSELYPVQIEAAKSILYSDHHLILSSSTASGKTEAVFFPILTNIYEHPLSSVGVLYISPLKSLINDQYFRISELLENTDLNVSRWHGDVSESKKKNVLDYPNGILQITPESLESLLMHHPAEIQKIFLDLRFVIIDEIHILMSTDRGNQILCQLARITRLIGHSPRRIGLSATISNPDIAGKWLKGETNISVDVPVLPRQKIHWKIGMEHFFTIENNHFEVEPFDKGYEYMYQAVKDTKSIVFSNSREETEYITATFKQIAKKRKEEDRFYIHHGNLSSSIREEAETALKDNSKNIVALATVTMELGIDIGKLERIVQSGSPTGVMSFLQRLGRSGRREQPPQMLMVFREDQPLPNTPLPQLIPWDLLRGIAIVQLYIEDRFIEPPYIKKMPLNLLFQQTLSMLASYGELTPAQLADLILNLGPFTTINKETYKELLVSMLNQDFLEMTEHNTLLIGLRGEKIVNNFKFYAIFKDEETWSIRNDSEEIGTISSSPPIGERFALAGNVWEVTDFDIKRRIIFVKSVDGKMKISWPGYYGEIHTRILLRMKQILSESTEFSYLLPGAKTRLEQIRHIASNTGINQKYVIKLGGFEWCFFPWAGTKIFNTIRILLLKYSKQLGINDLSGYGTYYFIFHMEQGNELTFIEKLLCVVNSPISMELLYTAFRTSFYEKYEPFIPKNLLFESYFKDRLDLEDTIKHINLLFNH